MKMFSKSTILLVIALSNSDAFSFGKMKQLSTYDNKVSYCRTKIFELYNSEQSADDEQPKEESKAEEGLVEEEEEEEEEEDPEIVAIKEEIKQLENELKYKKQKVQEVKDEADDYTKAGYARKVAQMENMRRRRSMMQSSDKSAASANVISEFLPILDELTILNEKYENNDFGKQYSGLKTALESSLQRLGVVEYVPVEGEEVNEYKTEIIDKIYSNDIPKNIIVQMISPGLELQGNIVRMSKAIVSLGPEPTEEEKEGESIPE